MMRETGRCLSGEKNDPGDNAKIQLFSFFSLSNSSFILSPRDEITGSAAIMLSHAKVIEELCSFSS